MSYRILSSAHLILASASPRRAQILKNLDIPFEVVVSKFPEEAHGDGDPIEHVLTLARRKAGEVAQRVRKGIVVGADTVVVLGGEILGKPQDEVEAAKMLRLLSGQVHHVITGLTLIDVTRGREVSGHESTSVRFRILSEEEIREYVASGEPMDKAGAYAIQGRGALLVEGIHGCFYNVVGLPLVKLTCLLERLRGSHGTE